MITWTSEIIQFISFEMHMDRPDKSKQKWDMTLTILAFDLLCIILVFLLERSQKWHFSHFFGFIQPVHVHLKTDRLDYLGSPK